MAIGHIQTNKSNPYIVRLQRILSGLKVNMEDLQDFTAMLSEMKNSGVVDSYITTQLGMASDALSQALVNEIESLSGKIDSDATVDHVQTAINQAYDKLA